MFKGHSRGVVASIALVIGTLLMSAVPVAAESVIEGCSGTCGYYEVQDMGPTGKKGAVCVYETGSSYDLDKITIRPPLMHGEYASKTPVRWRFLVLRANVNDGLFSTYYTSSWQSSTASETKPAYVGHGFARRTWTAPENPTGWFKVRIWMQWKASGVTVGEALVEYDHYKELRGGSSDYNSERCLQSW